MDNGGFYLKNLGKGSILVNNKEVNAGQSQKLLSNCLIEVCSLYHTNDWSVSSLFLVQWNENVIWLILQIRGMPFIFEINQSRVKSYLDNIPENN